MTLRLVYDGKSALEDDIADRHALLQKVITDVRGYLDPTVMAVLAAPVRTNTAAVDRRFQEQYPDTARVLVFRETTAPNERTAQPVFDPVDGLFLRLLVGRTKTVRMPVTSSDDTAVAFVFPVHDGVVQRDPLIFLGTVGGNIRSVGEVYASYMEYLAGLAADDEYTPPTPAELTALKAAAKAGLAVSTGAFVPKAEYESVVKRLAHMESMWDSLRRNFAAFDKLYNP